MSTHTTPAAPRSLDTALRVVVVGLGIDAYVHFHLASRYDGLKGSGSLAVSQGVLFRAEAVAAILAALLVVLVRHRSSAVIAFLVLAGGFAAVILYHYVDVGEIGPLPAMHDPVWTTEKAISAIAQGVAAVAALMLALQPARRRAPVT